MNYHNINHCDMLNGNGIRVSLWVSGCSVQCRGCQNQQTWDLNSGILFDEAAKQELFEALDKPYIKGLTLTGGHPLEPDNITTIYNLLQEVKDKFPQKDIWLYTGYTLDILNFTTIQKGINFKCEYGNCLHHNLMYQTLNLCDVVVDGPYIEDQRNISLYWRGSKNQRLIDVKETLKQGKIIQYKIN
jgi:anaerobic ribonucleoside-triphosphate reductase activating protein